jgi:hypothetical protein
MGYRGNRNGNLAHSQGSPGCLLFVIVAFLVALHGALRSPLWCVIARSGAVVPMCRRADSGLFFADPVFCVASGAACVGAWPDFLLCCVLAHWWHIVYAVDRIIPCLHFELPNNVSNRASPVGGGTRIIYNSSEGRVYLIMGYLPLMRTQLCW